MLSLYNWLTPKSLLILILHLFLLFALLLNATIPALAVPYSHLLLQNEVPDPKATPEIAASATTANGIPIPGSPLDIVVYDDGSLSLREAGKNHFYGSRASGVFLWIDNAVYGPYVPAGLTHYDYTVLTHVGPTGTGASSDPWRVSTSFQIGNTGITLQQDVTYINGARDIGFEWHLANSSGVQRNVTLFHAADLYVDGDDYGIGYVEPGKRTVGGYNQRTRIHGIFTPITPPDAYEENFFKTIWERIGGITRGSGLLNTIQTNYMDNGAGLQWNFSQFPGNARSIVRSRFSVAPLDTSGPQFEAPPTAEQIRNNPLPKLREFEFVASVAQSPDDYKAGPTSFAIPISRYYGDIGAFPDYNQRFSNLVAPKAQLTLRVFDVDSPDERYKLNINGKSDSECHVSGDVRGSNGAWLDISLTFDSKCLKFPNLPTPTGHPLDLHSYYQKQIIPSGLRLRASDNQFELLPVDSTGGYKTLIAWARITVGGVRPVLFSHGIDPFCSNGLDRAIGEWENWIYNAGIPGIGVLVDGAASLDTQILHWTGSYFEAQQIFGLRSKNTPGVAEPDRILAVGHSMGGLMARGFTNQQHSRDNFVVEQIVGYGTPNAGANIAKVAPCSYGARASLDPSYVQNTFNVDNNLGVAWLDWPTLYNGTARAKAHFFAIAARYDALIGGSDWEGDNIVKVGSVHALDYTTNYRYYWNSDTFAGEINFPVLHTTIPVIRSMLARITGCHPNYPNDPGMSIGVIVDPLRQAPRDGCWFVGTQAATTVESSQAQEQPLQTQQASPESQMVAFFTGQAAPGTSTQHIFSLDETGYIGVRPIPYTDNSNVTLTLIDPNGNRYNMQNASFYQENVNAGVWKIEIQGVSNNGDYSVQIETGSQLGLIPVPTAPNGSNNIVRGALATIGMQIKDNNNLLSHLTVKADIGFPDGQTQTLTLNDAGQDGDIVANDGIYSIGFQTNQNTPTGAYLVNYSIAGNRADGRAFQRVTNAGFTVLVGQGLTDTTTQWLPEDTNGNTLIDVVHGHIVANLTTAGNYFVVASLKDNVSGQIIGQTNTELVVSAEQVNAASGNAVQNVNLDFGGTYLGSLGTNLNLSLVNISLYNRDSGALLDYRSVLPGQINISPTNMETSLLLATVTSHSLPDSDSDGRADALRFTVAITSRFGGNYTLQATLQDSNGQPFAFTEQGIQLNSGQQNVSVDFSALQIVQNGVAGKFTLSNLSIVPIDSQNLQTEVLDLANLYSTPSLSLDLFEGGVTLTVTSNMPANLAYVRVAPANPSNIYLIGTEVSLEPVIVGSNVMFRNWLVNGESRSESPLSLKLNSNTTVQALFDGPQGTTPGDCNGDHTVGASDITALAQEFFDGDDNNNPAATSGGSYPGNPGCDANQDSHIGASDVTCIGQIFFKGPGACQADVSAATSATPVLSIPHQLPATSGGKVTVPIRLQTNGSAVNSLLFAVNYDEKALNFDAADNNHDGIPDAITFTLPQPFLNSVTFDKQGANGELHFVVTGFSSPPTALKDGPLLSVTFDVAQLPTATETAVQIAQLPAASFADTQGRALGGATVSGSVLIADRPAPTASATLLYLPLIVTNH